MLTTADASRTASLLLSSTSHRVHYLLARRRCALRRWPIDTPERMQERKRAGMNGWRAETGAAACSLSSPIVTWEVHGVAAGHRLGGLGGREAAGDWHVSHCCSASASPASPHSSMKRYGDGWQQQQQIMGHQMATFGI